MLRQPNHSKLWLERAAALKAKHDQQRSVVGRDLTTAMAELWRLVQDAPRPLVVAYRDLDDSRLAQAALVLKNELTVGRLCWEAVGDWQADALSIGAQLRALDAELATRPGFGMARVSTKSLFCETADAYVIPRARPKPTDRRPGPGNGMGRRATPHHRILPRLIDDMFEVDLISNVHLAIGPTGGSDQELGAALLPGLKMDWKVKDGIATAKDACCDDEAIIKEQVKGAYSSRLLAAVWPELTMPPARLKRLQAAITAKIDSAPPLSGPTIIVAGSWHERDGDTVRNIMRILDRSGEERLQFDKITTFVGGGFREANEPGNRIPVLINSDALVTFAICSDFCDLELTIPYQDLDVDLILVPSLGNEGALNGHEANARQLEIIMGAATFLVQQHEANEEPVGWVLPKAGSPLSPNENRAWSTRQVSFG